MAAKTCAMMGLLLVSRSGAVNHSDPSQESLSSLVSKSVTICGDDDIWDDLSKPSGISGIRAIDWQYIEGTMTEFLENQDIFIKVQDDKIQSYQAQIDKRSGGKKSQKLSQEQIEQMVDQVVEHKESFGSKDAAIATKCGKPMELFNNKRPNKAAFKNSGNKVIKEVAEAFWETAKQDGIIVHAEVDMFTRVCEDNLGFDRSGTAEENDIASYCDEMCADLAKAVRLESNKHAQNQGDVSALLRRKEKALQDKQTETDKKKLCTSAQTRILEFKSYLEQLTQIISEKYQLFQDAEWALSLAQSVLDEMVEKLLEQQRLVKEAKQGLTELGQAENDANEQLALAQASLQTSSDDLTNAIGTWKSLQDDLAKVRAAERYSDDVKTRLSKLLLSMDDFAEECVREPVRNVGLSEATDVYEGAFFKKNVKELQASEDMKSALKAFHEYCKGPATEVFKLVKDQVDLSPLCQLGEETETMDEITGAVQRRKDLVVKAIVHVQSWLDPFKGTLVTEDNEISDYVDQGEPKGLRRVVGPMTQGAPNQFYSNYLIKWKKHGEFQDLLQKVAKAVIDLDNKVAAAAREVEALTKAQQLAQNTLEDATAAYKKAVSEHNLEKEQLSAKATEMQLSVDSMKNSLDDLKKKKKEALEAWEQAKATLESEFAYHVTKTSLAENHAALE